MKTRGVVKLVIVGCLVLAAGSTASATGPGEESAVDVMHGLMKVVSAVESRIEQLDAKIRQYEANAPVGVPVGTIMAFAGPTKGFPKGKTWLVCQGQVLNVAEYPELFRAIGASWGGDGETTFMLPDTRGYFLRGVDPTSANDKEAAKRVASASGGASGANVGSKQGYSTAHPRNPFVIKPVKKHEHVGFAAKVVTGNRNGTGVPAHGGQSTHASVTSGKGGEHGHEWAGGGDQETRPTNLAVNYIIRVR